MFIEDSGAKDKNMDKGYGLVAMAINTKDNGDIIKCMVKVNFTLKNAVLTQAYLKTANTKDTEFKHLEN